MSNYPSTQLPGIHRTIFSYFFGSLRSVQTNHQDPLTGLSEGWGIPIGQDRPRQNQCLNPPSGRSATPRKIARLGLEP